MSKVSDNRFVEGGYVDVPFAKDLEAMGDEMARSIEAIFDEATGRPDVGVDDIVAIKRGMNAVKKWRDYKPGNR